MIDRRRFLAGGTVWSLLGTAASAQESDRIDLTGSLEQASRVLGHVVPGTKVTLDGAPLSVAADGTFVFGLAYDRTAPVELAAAFPGGGLARRPLAPIPRLYEVQHIDGLQPEYVAPAPDIAARIAAENARIRAALAADSDLTGFAEVFAWPVFGILSSWFGSRRVLNGIPKAPHFGVDVAAPEGTPIRAPAAGVVALAEADFFLTGGTTVIDHGRGLFSAYYHQSALAVTVGRRLARGDVIGAVGRTGRATGPHLHWSMNWFAMPLDPSRATAYVMPPRA